MTSTVRSSGASRRAGESLLVTVAGRPVAQLSPAANRKWVSGDSLAAVWRGPAPRDLVDDLGQLGAGVADPCVRDSPAGIGSAAAPRDG